MAFLPLVRIVDDSTSALIMEVPGFYSLPSEDDTIVLSIDGGAPTSYEVKGITYVIDAITGLTTPEGSPILNHTVRIEVRVQE